MVGCVCTLGVPPHTGLIVIFEAFQGEFNLNSCFSHRNLFPVHRQYKVIAKITKDWQLQAFRK